MLTFENLNTAFIGLSRELLDKGVSRETRSFKCIELPNPEIICIENPTDRYINTPERKWNKELGWVESLWIASGTNHMELVGDYVKNMYSFSDDGQFMRAAYGPRIRAFSGFHTDYAIARPEHRNVISGYTGVVDQLKFVVDSLLRDINTRQALITIHDPVKDDYEFNGALKSTKDTPCCRTVQFMVVNGKLDCTLTIRSNDLVWGFSAVNVFNFTLMQEYVAMVIGVPIGKYYHFVNNLHYYSDKTELLETVAKLNPEDYKSEFGVYDYNYPTGFTFSTFDLEINRLFAYEELVRKSNSEMFESNNHFIAPMFRDWALVFKNKWMKTKDKFINPYLNKLYGN